MGQWGASEERLVRGRTGVEAHLHWILQGNSRQAGPVYQGLAQDHVVGRALGFLGPSPGSDPPCSAPLGSPFLSLSCPWVVKEAMDSPISNLPLGLHVTASRHFTPHAHPNAQNRPGIPALLRNVY